jgi:4-alpha-glucanotransferase
MNPGSVSILPDKRLAGVGIHVTSLPGPFGIGDIGDAALAFIDEVAGTGIRVWQFLPTGPTAYGDSPYQPLSAFAGNENLIGLEPLVREGLLQAEETAKLRELPEDSVDYGRLIPLKNAVLAKAAERRGQVDGGLKAGYEDYLHRHDRAWLDDYALYRVIKTLHGERAWSEWQPRFIHREAPALAEIRRRFSAAMGRIKFLQFLFERQWRELRARARERDVLLFADMPIYIALDSADAWAHPEILRIDSAGKPSHVAGVPPDYFSEDGQLWGNPLYDWDHHAANGYRWWIERVRHAAAMADLVRIDHFRGFEAYWAVPVDSPTARIGTWEKGPGEALFDALHDALGHLPIVAEDLGVITPEVDALRHHHRIPGMAVLQFEIGAPDFDPDTIEVNCVCYTGTHDNDTTVGWFKGGHNDTRTSADVMKTRRVALKVTGGTAESIHTDLIALALSSKARVAIAPMQDFLGLDSAARLNTPGTTSNNWRWRLQRNQLTPDLRATMRNLIQTSSRTPPDRLN